MQSWLVVLFFTFLAECCFMSICPSFSLTINWQKFYHFFLILHYSITVTSIYGFSLSFNYISTVLVLKPPVNPHLFQELNFHYMLLNFKSNCTQNGQNYRVFGHFECNRIYSSVICLKWWNCTFIFIYILFLCVSCLTISLVSVVFILADYQSTFPHF